MKETLIALFVIMYDLVLLAGTAYLVQEHGWSMWTFLLAMFFFMTCKTKDPVQ